MEKKIASSFKKRILLFEKTLLYQKYYGFNFLLRLLNERLILPIQKLPHQILLVHPASGVTGVTMRTSLQELQRHYF